MAWGTDCSRGQAAGGLSLELEMPGAIRERPALPANHPASRARAGPFCATPRQLAHATVGTRLQPHRTCVPAKGQGRVETVGSNGLGNSQYPPWNEPCPERNPQGPTEAVRELA